MRATKVDIEAVQRDYPKIYLACHRRHVRRRHGRGLTPQESTLLAHLSADVPTRAARLAEHLGVGAPAMSATLKRLIAAGLVTRARDTADGRVSALRLSSAGAQAMRQSSVLDTARVARMLNELPPAARRRGLAGLALLAEAALRVSKEGE